MRLLEVVVSKSFAPPATDRTMPLDRRELAAAVWPGGAGDSGGPREGEASSRLAGLLAELNAPQREVARRPDGPLLVVAGPGAGKTRAIVARVAYLLLARGVPADEIMAITFSRRAAGELEERLAALVGLSGEMEAVSDGDIPGLPPERRAARTADVASTAPRSAGDGPRRVWAGTFHALGARLLRRGGAAHFGRPLGFTIYDQDDVERALRRVLGSLGVPDNRVGRVATTARQAISLVKRHAPGGVAPIAEDVIGEGADALPLRDVLSRYDADLREAAAFDFDDLVSCATAALDRDSALRAWAQARARHLLVDEYQDTDPAQEALLHRLSPPADPSRSAPHRRSAPDGQVSGELASRARSTGGQVSGGRRDLCVVADPQQSIYAFRGAAPAQVHRFALQWPGAGLIRLEQNYRSTKSIVAIARRLVAPSAAPSVSRLMLRPGEPASDGAALASGAIDSGAPGAPAVPAAPESGLASRRFVLRLWTENPAGVPARLWIAPHPDKEADAIARDIAAKLGTGWSPEEMAILVRTHAQARPIEAALLRAKVPYALFGGVRFFGREEIKDILAYLRLAILREDAAAFWRVVNTPRRGLGPAALLTIARHALAGAPGVAAAGGAEPGPVAATRRWAATETAPDGLYDLLAHLDELAGLARAGAGPAALLEAALDRTHYRDHLRREHPDSAPARLDALAELLRLATPYTDSRQFLDDAVLSGEDDDPGAQSRGRVRLSTVHAAKGLEFRAVYVPGCEQGLFPLGGGTLPGAPFLDPEERRVFYVAVTRAKELLTLSYCTFRRDERTQPSPFLAEIGRGLIRRAKLGSDEPPPRRPPRPRPISVAPTTAEPAE